MVDALDGDELGEDSGSSSAKAELLGLAMKEVDKKKHNKVNMRNIGIKTANIVLVGCGRV